MPILLALLETALMAWSNSATIGRVFLGGSIFTPLGNFILCERIKFLVLEIQWCTTVTVSHNNLHRLSIPNVNNIIQVLVLTAFLF